MSGASFGGKRAGGGPEVTVSITPLTGPDNLVEAAAPAAAPAASSAKVDPVRPPAKLPPFPPKAAEIASVATLFEVSTTLRVQTHNQ